MAGLTFAKLFPGDWRGGTLYQLTVEEEGMYMRSCVYMWDTGECIPGDDRLASRLLNVQVQKYQKLMGALIEKGKMTRGQGVVFNERVLEEISEFQRQSGHQSLRAKRGHETRRLTANTVKELMEEVERLKQELASKDQPPQQPPDQPPVAPGGGCLGGTPDVPPGVPSKKTNEINGGEQNGQKSGTAEARSLEARSQNKELGVGAGLQPDEELLDHGVIVNCRTVRHASFQISISAVEQQLALQSDLGLTVDEAKTYARAGSIAQALAWAAEIENGRNPGEVLPRNCPTANFVRGSIARQLLKKPTTVYGGPSRKAAALPAESVEQRKRRLMEEAAAELRGRK